MQWKKVLFAIIVGIILFVTEFNFGWMSFGLGGIWAIFIIVFIVGILAGDISGGFVAGFLTLFLSVGLLAVIPALVNPEFGIAATDILSRMWLVMALSLSFSTRFPDAPVPWVETLVIVILLIVLAPVVYVMALLFGPIGGGIGRIIHPRIFKSGAPVRAATPVHQSSAAPSPQEESIEDTTFPEPESAPEEESEDEFSAHNQDSSE